MKNCVALTLTDGDFQFRTGTFILAFYSLFHIAFRYSRRRTEKKRAEFASYVISSIHAICVCLASISFMAHPIYLPIAVAYFTVDLVCYAIPARDIFIIAHHAIMVLFPIAWYPQTGDLQWLATWIYAIEWSNLGLNMNYFSRVCYAPLAYNFSGYYILIVYGVTRLLWVPYILFTYYRVIEPPANCFILEPLFVSGMLFIFLTAIYYYFVKIVGNLQRLTRLQVSKLKASS